MDTHSPAAAPSPNANLAALAAAGVSIWLDDLSRRRLLDGDLITLPAGHSVSGVTTNPAIFHAAVTGGDDYTPDIRRLGSSDVDVEPAIWRLTTDDVRNACDQLAPIALASGGVDGKVSIEVDPRLAESSDATVAQARYLWGQVARENLLVKIPATRACLPAISQVIASGIGVNVTLIFSVDRYREVMEAYLEGLESALGNGIDLARIHSVASFFVSRVDTEIDRRLEDIGGDALALRGKAALANARLAWAEYEQVFVHGERFRRLAEQGARPQRPLWASTGTKNPDYPDTLYVTELVAPGTVNTLPEKTLLAVADHGEVRGDTMSGTADESRAVFASLREAGIDIEDVFAKLETVGVQAFVAAWERLLDDLRARLAGA